MESCGGTDVPNDVGQNMLSTPTWTLPEPRHQDVGHEAQADLGFLSSWRTEPWPTETHRLTGVA